MTTVAEEAARRDEASGVEARVAVHDGSRLEWSVSLPMPTSHESSYSIDFQIEIPSHLFPQHAPWERLQQFARLDQAESPSDSSTIDGLRRHVVSLAARVTRTSEGFARHCRLLTSPAPAEDVVDGLRTWLDGGVRVVTEARRTLVPGQASDPEELGRERTLVDEYLSTRLVELLAGAERALDRAVEAGATLDVSAASRRIAEVLEGEVEYRRGRGFVDASSGSARDLERYTERASLLKKHFQEVLFLEPERYAVADRIHHLVAAIVAIVASTWAFMWQIMLANRSTSGTALSGLVAVALIAGVVYAAKDRIKEVGRAWVAGKVHKLYAQRVVRFQLPEGRHGASGVLVRARESFHETESARPDPLNPDSAARVRFTVVEYVQRGQIVPSKRLADEGTRVKQVFRYDLSPLFARLDDATKQVPVFDKGLGKVRFADAARYYRLPMRLTVEDGAAPLVQEGVLVVHKRGLERVERTSLAP